MPKGTYQPGLEVKLKILDEKMDIVNMETSEIIVSHSVSIGKGKLIKIHHPERVVNKSIEEIYQKTLLELGDTDKSRELLDNIGKEKSRYIRDQFGLILKEIKNYEKTIILETVEYCVERKLYCAGIFKDALAYVSSRKNKIDANKIYKPVKLDIPLKYQGLKPQTRDINEYIDCFNGGNKKWKN